MILLKYVYKHVKYTVAKQEHSAKIMQPWWKNNHDATTFNCWFETLSDTHQNGSTSVSAVLRQSV